MKQATIEQLMSMRGVNFLTTTEQEEEFQDLFFNGERRWLSGDDEPIIYKEGGLSINSKGELCMPMGEPNIKIFEGFKTQQEIWRYLAEGHGIRSSNNVCFFKDGRVRNKHENLTHIIFDTPMNWEPYYKKPEWWESRNEFTLCWVWDNKHEDKEIATVKKEKKKFISVAYTPWIHAQPLTQGEIKKYSATNAD